MNDDQFNEWIDQLKDVDIADVCESLGIEITVRHRTRQLLCPFHSDKHLGSCVIRKNRIQCFACNKTADTIELVRHVRNYTFIEACNYIADISGIPTLSEQSKHSNQDNQNIKPMPIQESQLKQLGLLKNVRIFLPSGWREHKLGCEDLNLQMVEDGYLVGTSVTQSLYSFFQNDEIGFNYMLLGKLHEVLIDKISDYMVKTLSFEEHRTLEQDIENLLPLANYYRQVAPGYGYNLDFIDQYKRKPAFAFTI